MDETPPAARPRARLRLVIRAILVGLGAASTLDDMEAVAREVPEIDAWDPRSDVQRGCKRGGTSATARVRANRNGGRRCARGVSRGQDSTRRLSQMGRALIGERAHLRRRRSDRRRGRDRQRALPRDRVLDRFGVDHGMDRDSETLSHLDDDAA
jgi:hypothetical protein